MEEKGTKIVKKKRFNFKKFLILLLFLYVFGYGIYYVFKLPIKNIVINGTDIISDYEVITVAKIKNYPSIFKTSTSKLKKKIKTLELVKDVTIKKSLTGVLTININEKKVLFINKNNNKIILEDGEKIDNNYYLGIPILLNYVPEEKLTNFIKGFTTIKPDIIKMISEIEYSQYISSTEEIIDDERFLLRMNDGNTVYINIPNIKKLNYYQDFAELSLTGKGILYLDSNSDTNTVFERYEE